METNLWIICLPDDLDFGLNWRYVFFCFWASPRLVPSRGRYDPQLLIQSALASVMTLGSVSHRQRAAGLLLIADATELDSRWINLTRK